MDHKTILVVDDEAHILHVVSLKLRNAGYNVITANDGEEALDAAAHAAVDLVITDYQMPGISGLELSRRLHSEPGRKRLPILMLTAHGLALDAVELSQAGVSACTSKPFSPREVLAQVQGLLEAVAPPAASVSCGTHV